MSVGLGFFICKNSQLAGLTSEFPFRLIMLSFYRSYSHFSGVWGSGYPWSSTWETQTHSASGHSIRSPPSSTVLQSLSVGDQWHLYNTCCELSSQGILKDTRLWHTTPTPLSAGICDSLEQSVHGSFSEGWFAFLWSKAEALLILHWYSEAVLSVVLLRLV